MWSWEESAPGSWNSRSKGPRVGLILFLLQAMGRGQSAQAQIAQAWRALGREAGVLAEGAEQSGKDLELEKQVRDFCWKTPLWV